MFKIFGKSKKQSSKENKENVGSLKRDVAERSSTRSENVPSASAYDHTGRPLDRHSSLNASMHGRVMRPLINPYSVWTEEKKTKGPSSWAGGPTQDDRHYARPSTHRLRQHNLDAIEERPSREHHHRPTSHNHSFNMPSSHSYASHSHSHSHHHRMSILNDVESEDDDNEYYARAIEKKDRHIRKLKDEVCKLQDSLESKNDEIDSLRHEAAYSRKKLKEKLESCKSQNKELKRMLEEEKDKNVQLEAKMMSICCGSSREGRSNGAEERLMSSSETSVEMSTEERVMNTINSDEVQDYSRLRMDEECEKPRSDEHGGEESMRRCASDTLLSTSHPHHAMMESCHSGGYSRPHKEIYFPSQWDTSDSSDGEELFHRRRSDSSDAEDLRLREKQLTKIGEVVKYNPPRNKLQQRHYRRYGKHEISALGQFRFLETENTDVSGMLSSPDVTTYYH